MFKPLLVQEFILFKSPKSFTESCFHQAPMSPRLGLCLVYMEENFSTILEGHSHDFESIYLLNFSNDFQDGLFLNAMCICAKLITYVIYYFMHTKVAIYTQCIECKNHLIKELFFSHFVKRNIHHQESLLIGTLSLILGTNTLGNKLHVHIYALRTTNHAMEKGMTQNMKANI